MPPVAASRDAQNLDTVADITKEELLADFNRRWKQATHLGVPTCFMLVRYEKAIAVQTFPCSYFMQRFGADAVDAVYREAQAFGLRRVVLSIVGVPGGAGRLFDQAWEEVV